MASDNKEKKSWWRYFNHGPVHASGDPEKAKLVRTLRNKNPVCHCAIVWEHKMMQLPWNAVWREVLTKQLKNRIAV